jgi:hypothetical protein
LSSTQDEIEMAAANLLGGPGDHLAEQLEGEIEMEAEAEVERATAAAAAAAQKELGSFGQEKKTAENVGSIIITAPLRWAAAALAATRNALSSLLCDAEVIFLRALKAGLDLCPPCCLATRAFAFLAAGPLRPSVLRFYARASDHTRRLIGVQANAKFAGPGAGPGIGLNVSYYS